MTARALPDKAAPMASSASQFCQVSFGLEVSELIHSGPIAAQMRRKYSLTPHHYKQTDSGHACHGEEPYQHRIYQEFRYLRCRVMPICPVVHAVATYNDRNVVVAIWALARDALARQVERLQLQELRIIGSRFSN